MLGTYALLGLPPSVPLMTLGFCGVVLVYQLDRGLDMSPEDHHNRPERTAWMQSHRVYVAATIIGAMLIGSAVVPLLRPITVIVGGGLGLLGLLHVWPVLQGGRRLKAWGWAKPFAIGGAWAFGAVLLPVLEAGHPVTWGVLMLIGYRLALVVVNTLLSDWGDRTGDARVGLRTLATMGPSAAVFRVAYTVLGTLVVGGIGAVAADYAPYVLLVDLVGVLLMGAVVWRVQHDAAWAHHIAVDAVVAWPVITFLVAW